MQTTKETFARITFDDGKTAVTRYTDEEKLKSLQLDIITDTGKTPVKTEVIDITTYYKEFLVFVTEGALASAAGVMIAQSSLEVEIMSMPLRMAPSIMKQTLAEIEELGLDIEIKEEYRQLANGKIDRRKATMRVIEDLFK